MDLKDESTAAEIQLTDYEIDKLEQYFYFGVKSCWDNTLGIEIDLNKVFE